jgi:membrane-bound serine protease (ClpP class)
MKTSAGAAARARGSSIARRRRRPFARPRALRIALTAVLAAMLLLVLRPSARAVPVAADSGARVLLVPLEGPVTPLMAETLSDALRRAEAGRYRALVLEIDTPGGLMTSMHDMIKELLAARVPVIAWVAPSGSRAASAGVFITIACDVAAMAPGTNIGAATPINMQGPMDSTLAHKMTNDAAAFAHSVATQRGRNADWAVHAVREAAAVDENEALKLGVVDFLAATPEELLAKADGRTWRRDVDVRTLHVAGAKIERIEPGFRQRLLSHIADPNISYILLMLGFYGLLFELQNPGAVLPGVVGGICLILAFLALSTLPVSTAGLALIALAVVFFIAEVKVASHGLLAAGGVISMLLGSVILFHGEDVRLSKGVILGATLTTALFFIVVIRVGLAARRLRVTTGSEGMTGARGVALSRLAPGGRVRVRNETWNAVSENAIEAGDEIVVTGAERLTLRVRPASREDS